MNSTPRPAIDISRFEFRIALVCLLTWIGTLGLGDEARGQDLAGDRQALVAFYNATDGANWRNNRNWLSDEPLDAWYGVTVSDGRVTELDLWRNRLTGPIPAELENLSSLTELSLERKPTDGADSRRVGGPLQPQRLSLEVQPTDGADSRRVGEPLQPHGADLGANQLTGPIPAELGNLSSLTELLYLGANQLTGPIPAELGNLSSLTELYLGGNQLTGPIPAELGSLSSLTDSTRAGSTLSLHTSTTN